MSDQIYFLDTYAMFEIINGNPNYLEYTNADMITTIFNLAELNYNLKKEKSRDAADDYTDKYNTFVVEVTLDDIKLAMDLKIKNKHLSIPDAVGYAVSQKHGAKFLTGDEDFRHISGVEFVK